MKGIVLAVFFGFAFYVVNAHADTWQPSPGHQQIALWPEGKMPDALPITKPESVKIATKFVAGKPWTWIADVTQPTITIYSPTTRNTGAAVIVFPGGGFKGLAIDLEGTEICEWLAAHGITGILLKYRVPNSGPNGNGRHSHIRPYAPAALEDAQRAIGLVRLNAAKWHINPNKIGVIGFSAGGYMVADISTHFKKRAYSPIDAADKEGCRPDFAIALYPGHMKIDEFDKTKSKEFALNPDIQFTKETPPTFLLQAENDPVDTVDYSLLYYIGLKNAGVPVEMHLYTEGGHAFGLRRTKFPITEWPPLMETWLKTIGMIQQ
jgi:acetyl esterase/lipase